MFKLPKKKTSFQLRFDNPEPENGDAENKNEDTAPHFEVPDNAEYKLVNKLPAYMVTLVDGQVPETREQRDVQLTKVQAGEIGTRQAILFCHTKIDPMKVPHDDWILHDGASLTQGTVNSILLHRSSAELMHNWDVVYKISPHPRKSGEVAIREIYLCPVGTLSTSISDSAADPCYVCARPATTPCRCQAVFFCNEMCRHEADRPGVHDADDCLRLYAENLVERSAVEREKAIELGKKRAERQQDQAESHPETPKPDPDIDDKGR